MMEPQAQAMGPPTAGPEGTVCMPSELSFDTVCRFLDRLAGTKGHKARTRLVELFMRKCIHRPSRDAYSVFRLVLPGLDLERGVYQLQELRLAQVLLRACNLSAGSDPGSLAHAALSWRRPAGSYGAAAVGDFARSMEQILFSRYCSRTAGTEGAKALKVGELNAQLDRLAEAAGRPGEQAQILQQLISSTTPGQMRWLTQIILKNLKVGVSEKTVLSVWHAGGQDYYNRSGMNLREVFNTLIDPGQPIAAAVIPGKVVRPQLAQATLSAEAAWEKMHRDGELLPFVMETKFDGERVQVHCSEAGLQYFSRKALDNSTRYEYSVLDQLFMRQVKYRRYILDGELVAWNKTRGYFEPFGGIKAVVGAVRKKKAPWEAVYEHARKCDGAVTVRDLDLVYVAFDILYVEDRPVVDLPLRERQALLRGAFREGTPSTCVVLRGSSIGGRLVPLIPGETMFNGVLASHEGQSKEDIGRTLDRMAELREEGIVVKALDSPWVPDGRGTNWLKLKPDYVSNMDIDCLVVGAWYGTGRRGGSLSQYLLALRSNKDPNRWLSFARVGNGVSDEERAAVFQRLEGNLTEEAPACYRVTGREGPDLWVADPWRSVVVAVQADLRVIRNEQFATRHSLRFPRIALVRYDKGPAEVTSVDELDRIVEEGAGMLAISRRRELQSAAGRLKRKGSGAAGGARPRPPKKLRALVPTGRLTSASNVRRESRVFQGMRVCFADYGDLSKEQAEGLVLRHGGELCLSESHCTHICAGCGGKKPFRVKRAEAEGRDVLSIAWLQECGEAKRKVPLRPRHYVHLSKRTLQASQDWDCFGDPFYSPIEGPDVERLLHGAMAGFTFDASRVPEGLEGGWVGGLPGTAGAAGTAAGAQEHGSAGEHKARDVDRRCSAGEQQHNVGKQQQRTEGQQHRVGEKPGSASPTPPSALPAPSSAPAVPSPASAPLTPASVTLTPARAPPVPSSDPPAPPSGPLAPSLGDLLRELNSQLAELGALDPRLCLLREVHTVVLTLGHSMPSTPNMPSMQGMPTTPSAPDTPLVRSMQSMSNGDIKAQHGQREQQTQQQGHEHRSSTTVIGVEGVQLCPGVDRLSRAVGQVGVGAAEALLCPDVARLSSAVGRLERELRDIRVRQLQSAVQLHGGQVSTTLHSGVTHLICVEDVRGEEHCASPASLLGAVRQQAGGGQGGGSA